MPYAPNGTWVASTASLSKALVNLVRFDGLASVQFSTGPVKNPSRSTKLYLSDVNGLSQRVDPLTGRFTIGTWEFVLTDKSGEVTDMASTERSTPTFSTMNNRRVELWSGYAQDDESTYAIIAVGFITELKMQGIAAYAFSAADTKANVIMDIFTNAQASGSKLDTLLTAAVSAGDGVVFVNSADAAERDGWLFLRQAGGSHLEELVQINTSFADQKKILFKTPLVNSYSVGDTVRWASTRLRGNPVNILYSILTSTFSLSGSFPLLSFDGAPTGIGIAVGDVDTAGLIKERDDWLNALVMSFEITSRQKAKQFLEDEIFRLLGYPYVTPDGKFSFKAYGPRRPTDTIYTVGEADIRAMTWKRRFDLAINRVTAKFDYDAERNQYITTRVYEDATDQATAGIHEITIQSKGIQSGQTSESYLEQYAKRLINRFKKGAVEIECDLHLTKRDEIPGESIDLTHSKLPNARTGTRGIAPMIGQPAWEILRLDHSFLNPPKIAALYQDTSWTRPAFIAPNGQADYGSASATEKKRAYINPTGSTFADGTEAYKVI